MSKTRGARHYILGRKSHQHFLGRLKHTGFFIATVAGSIALTALVTSFTERTPAQLAKSAEAPAAAPVAKPVPAPTTTVSKSKASKLMPVPVQKPEPKPRPQSEVQPQPQPSTKATSNPAKSSPRKAKKSMATCKADRATAKRHHKQRQADEHRRHKKAVRSIQRTGWLTRILNPGAYHYKTNDEATKHDKNLVRINASYHRELTAARCS